MNTLMIHRDFPHRKPTVTTMVAFDRVWQHRGWELVGILEPVGPQPEDIDYTALTVPELRDLATSLGHTGVSSLKKAALVDLVSP